MELWNRQIKLARYMLLGTVIVTVFNIAFLLGNVDMFISYCAALPYYLVWLGKLFDNGYFLGHSNGQFTATGLLMGGILLAGYLIVWWLARRNRRWLQVSLWLIVADLVVLVLIALTLFTDPMSCFWEFVIHLAVIWEIAQGLKAQRQRDAAIQRAQEAEALLQEQAQENIDEPPSEDSTCEEREVQEECPL